MSNFENKEGTQKAEEWFSLTPSEVLPEDAKSWEIEIPGRGKMKVEMLDKLGVTEQEDGRVYVLGGEAGAISVKPEALIEQGPYRTLQLRYDAPNKDRPIWLEVRADSTKFETIMTTSNKGSVELANGYWSEVIEGETSIAGRDIMTMPDTMKRAQVRFVPRREIQRASNRQS